MLPVRLSHFMRLLISLVIFRLTLACWLSFVRLTARFMVKCPRCWNHRALGGNANHGSVCERCGDALDAIGFAEGE